MTNPELISFYDGYSRLNVRAKRDDQVLVEIQYRKTVPFNCGSRLKVRVAFPDSVPLAAEEGFDPQGVWIRAARPGVEKMLEDCVRDGHISQTTMTLMLAAIDDRMLKSKSSTGLDAGAGWVKMIDGEPKWGYWPEPAYDPYDG